jgi:GNAT superfamily N-acetyltransferase
MDVHIRQAGIHETEAVSNVLTGAAQWLVERGTPMWKADELNPERVAGDVADGLFFVAGVSGTIAGTVKFQLEDPLFWPDQPKGEAAYVHRLAIRREFAGKQVSSTLLHWAAERAHALGRRYLRLDCEATRPRLRAFYERFGFSHHSDRRVGPYFVSRYELEVAVSAAGEAAAG